MIPNHSDDSIQHKHAVRNELRYLPHRPPWNDPYLTWEKRRTAALWDERERVSAAALEQRRQARQIAADRRLAARPAPPLPHGLIRLD